jgi:TPR repeat protein
VSVVPSAAGKMISRSTSLVSRGLNLIETQQSSEDVTISVQVQAAEKGHADAQCSLGWDYYLGLGDVPQDYVQAAAWFLKAADQGWPGGFVALGYLYENTEGVKDYTRAAFFYRKAADHGDAEAQTYLGALYERGRGVPQDEAQAMAWFRKAADQGFAHAQFRLGFLYADTNDPRAVDWYLRAADEGHPTAIAQLAITYELGRGVPQDRVEAYKWWTLASSPLSLESVKLITDWDDFEKYKSSRDAMESGLNPQEVSEGQRRANHWRDAFQKRNGPMSESVSQ